MKYFRLANADFRNSVDLTRYEDDIFQAVQKVKPDTKVTVTPNYFTTTPELGKMESILVSKQLRMGGLKEYTLYRPCLFNSYRQSDKEQQEVTDERGNTMDRHRRNPKKLSSPREKENQRNRKKES